MSKFKFDVYMNNLKGILNIHGYTEQNVIERLIKLPDIALEKLMEDKQESEVTIDCKLVVFYNGKLIKKVYEKDI